MQTSEILNLAADAVERHGWTSGASGWPGMNKFAGDALCLEGGIMAALGYEFVTVDLSEFFVCPAYQAVQRHLGLDLGFRGDDVHTLRDPLWTFNDAPERTATEVIETLRATAVIEAAREDAAAPVEVSA